MEEAKKSKIFGWNFFGILIRPSEAIPLPPYGVGVNNKLQWQPDIPPLAIIINKLISQYVRYPLLIVFSSINDKDNVNYKFTYTTISKSFMLL